MKHIALTEKVADYAVANPPYALFKMARGAVVVARMRARSGHARLHVQTRLARRNCPYE